MKLSAINIRRLDAAIAHWSEWTPPPIAEPVMTSRLGGLTNLSFLVTDGNACWVVRLNNDINDSGINRQHELTAITAAHHAGIAPRVVCSEHDFFITEFLSGNSPSLEDIAEIGLLFTKIHSLNVSTQPLDLLAHLKAYHLQAYSQQIKPDKDVADCYGRVMALSKPKITTHVLCHQDLTLQNMIKVKDRIVAIDWEYVRQSDPAYDLAVFTYTQELNQEQSSELLHSYSRNEPELTARIAYFERVYAMIEIFWWLIRGKKINIRKLQSLLDAGQLT
ncbi:MAG: phosphotransferase [Proteobacteria bacterium]|nr:phosphotransferase [Pseudomonadota bacterium]